MRGVGCRRARPCQCRRRRAGRETPAKRSDPGPSQTPRPQGLANGSARFSSHDPRNGGRAPVAPRLSERRWPRHLAAAGRTVNLRGAVWAWATSHSAVGSFASREARPSRVPSVGTPTESCRRARRNSHDGSPTERGARNAAPGLLLLSLPMLNPLLLIRPPSPSSRRRGSRTAGCSTVPGPRRGCRRGARLPSRASHD
jgi:hypothetical protein